MDQAVSKQLEQRAATADRSKVRLYLTGADVPS
jgi:hypothetical protein